MNPVRNLRRPGRSGYACLENAEGMDYADYGGWRLPDVKELQSIVEYTLTR